MKNLYICKHENGHGYCLLNDEYCPQSPCKDEEIITYAPVKQGWISVKDRLPKRDEEVLVYWDDGFEIGRYVGGEVGENVYWMPLPEPPKEEKENG